MKILSTPENHQTFPLAIITSKSTFANCWAWNVVTPVPSPGNETRSNHQQPSSSLDSLDASNPKAFHSHDTFHIISAHKERSG